MGGGGGEREGEVVSLIAGPARDQRINLSVMETVSFLGSSW